MRGLEGGEGRRKQTGRQAKMERERDGKGENEEKKEEEGALAWAEKGWVGEGWRWSNRLQDERDGDKQQHHFSSLLTGLPSMTHDDRRQNGHPNKHQYSGSNTQRQGFNTQLSNRGSAASGAINAIKETICQFSTGLKAW